MIRLTKAISTIGCAVSVPASREWSLSRCAAMHTSEPIANADLKAQKRAMRKEVSKRLANLSEREVESQSSAVAGRLRAMQKVWESSCSEGSVVSAYLPMEGGREVNTFLIIEALCAEGARVAVP